MPRDMIEKPGLADFIGTLCAAMDHDSRTPKALTEALMGDMLAGLDLDPFLTARVTESGYARNLVHTDSKGRFSVLALEWLPGAVTPIHGHKAWGCVGVMEGTIGCDTFEVIDEASHRVHLTDTIHAGRGAIAAVDPKPSGIHRLFNAGKGRAVTLHVYGLDLSADPCCINVPYHL